MAYAQIDSLHTHPQLSSGARGLMFGLAFHLLPYLVYVSNVGSDDQVRLNLGWLSLR